MALADDLQVIAFAAVAEGDSEYRLRYLHRWYSKTFHTPLHVVPSIPLTAILTAFWEEKYEAMEEDDLEAERLRLIETPEERRARLVVEDQEKANADSFFERIKAEIPKKVEQVAVQEPIAVKTRERLPELPSADDTKGVPLPDRISIQFQPTDFFNELVEKLDSSND